MPLLIPEQAREPLTHLYMLSPAQREQLINALANAKPALSLEAFAARLDSVEYFDDPELPSVVGTIMSLYRLQEHTGRSPSELASDLISALRDEDFADFGSNSEGVTEFESFITRLLSLDDTVGVSTKAEELSLELANIFGSARILTDLRPIFLGKDDPDPRAATVVHTLKIEIHESDAAYYFALDNVDIRTLSELIQRALKKEEALRRMVAGSGLTLIER